MRRYKFEQEYSRRVEDIGSNTARASLGRKALKIEFGIRAGSHIITTEIWARVATEAALCFVFLLAIHGIADKHAETLRSISVAVSHEYIVEKIPA